MEHSHGEGGQTLECLQSSSLRQWKMFHRGASGGYASSIFSLFGVPLQ